MSNLNNTLTMEITINAIHFDATEKLQDFIEKKVQKLQKSYEDIKKVEVKLTVVKPATERGQCTLRHSSEFKNVGAHEAVAVTLVFFSELKASSYRLFHDAI